MLYQYPVRVRGVDPCEVGELEVGEEVWVKLPNARCDERHKKGMVTNVISEQAVEVDGLPRHVKDLHRVTSQQPAAETTASRTNEEELLVELQSQADTGDEVDMEDKEEEEEEEEQEQEPAERVLPRWSSRVRIPRVVCELCD
ncbi:hypothetical protein E2C01_043461 [Portunus trituberculatus]|uniref:Uncharacterized protein n=1 Tax=Portunus trituberculatus TaxID=210409 RepID=A0A5B7FT20_PORTR|nr:hypothetical protein [Portunus trituberculatus]